MLWILAALVGGPPSWEEIKRPENISVALYDRERWLPPEILPAPVNSRGWEDSAEVSWDGDKILFLYSPCDIRTGAKIDPGPRKGWESGRLDSDIMLATREGQGWKVEDLPAPVSSPGWEGCAHYCPSLKYLIFSRSEQRNGKELRRLMFSKGAFGGAWSNPLALPVEVNKPGVVNDNPHTRGNVLYFERSGSSGLDLLTTAFPRLAEPKAVTAWNGPSDDGQLWADPGDDHVLYCRDHAGFFEWVKGMSQPRLVLLAAVLAPNGVPMKPKYLAAIGEPTLDRAGNLYFVAVFKREDGSSVAYDADIVVMRAKGVNP